MSDDNPTDENADEAAPARVFVKKSGQFTRDEGDSKLTTFRVQESLREKRQQPDSED